jgi:hypothetical protein
LKTLDFLAGPGSLIPLPGLARRTVLEPELMGDELMGALDDFGDVDGPDGPRQKVGFA